MDTKTELILGFGRTLKAVRDREGITQKQLSDGMNVSLNQVKKYEQENLEEIGPNGFSIKVLSNLADFLDIHPEKLFHEVVGNSELAGSLNASSYAETLQKTASKETLQIIADDCSSNVEPFGNLGKWELDMAANLSKLPAKVRSRIGGEILRLLLENNLVSKEAVGKQMQDLISYTYLNSD